MWHKDAENSAAHNKMYYILQDLLHFVKYKTVILNRTNISQLYCFFFFVVVCLFFDQINSEAEERLSDPKHLC